MEREGGEGRGGEGAKERVLGGEKEGEGWNDRMRDLGRVTEYGTGKAQRMKERGKQKRGKENVGSRKVDR